VISNKAAEAIERLASNGLPIIFIGSTPDRAYPIEDKDKVDSTMLRVLSGPSIHHMDTIDQLPTLLQDLRTTPRVSLNCSSSPVYPVYRASVDADYVFFFNDQKVDTECTAIVSVQDADPYELSAWTGDETPAPATYNHKTLSMRLSFKAGETRLFALKRSVSPSSCSDMPRTFHAADETSVSLTAWNLTIDDWHSAPDRFAVKTEITTHNLLNVPLLPWNQLNTTLEPVSGVGHYTTSFIVPEAVTAARLYLPLIQHTARIFLDDNWLGPIDPVNPQLLLKDLVVGREYTLRVDIITTLLNRVKADAKEIRMAGMVPDAAFVNTTFAEYGLVGEAEVVWGVLE
jgi:hypothetical protein